jgi:hypothetical protein
MPRLPKFDRVLVVVRPHGGYIMSGQKTALVKSRRYYMENEVLLVIQNKHALGTLRLAPPSTISLSGFRRLRKRHLVTEEERKRWWPRKTKFYLYDVVSVRPLRRPVAVDYPQGPQVFVRKENLVILG